MGAIMNVYRTKLDNIKGRYYLRPRRKREDNIEMGLKIMD
jgi:hypothetical protein